MKKTHNQETKIEEVLDYERIRYIRKGYGLITAILVALGWFFLIPKLVERIWPHKIENQAIPFFLYYTVHEASFIIMNFVMWIVYNLEWSFIERYKILDSPWPWNQDPEKWKNLLKKTIISLLINQLIVLPLLIGSDYFISKVSPYRTDLDSFPSSFEIIWQTIVFMVIEDFSFYWTHRALHWDKIYPYIHKIHHQYVYSVSIASEYSHPVEYLLSNCIPSSLGPLILGKKVHLATYLLWIVLRVAETTDGHSGYDFSWSPFRLLPMSGSSEFHQYHHVVFKGNYSSFFTYLDRLCGTVNKRYEEHVEKMKEKINTQENKLQNLKEKQN